MTASVGRASSGDARRNRARFRASERSGLDVGSSMMKPKRCKSEVFSRVGKVASIALAGLGMLTVSGCNIIAAGGIVGHAIHEAGSTKVEAEYKRLRGETVAVVVYMDQYLRANDPRLANRLTNAITRVLSQPQVGLAGIVPGSLVLEFQYSRPAWPTWSYQEIADEFTVSRLVVIDLYEYRLHEPGNRYVWDGRAAARVGVFESGTGSNEFAYRKDVVVRFPDQMGMLENEISRNAVMANLEQRLVDRITWLMYDHEVPNTLKY